ncbi:hypothetical protein V1L54_05025 [Streptomyces sp. TRM 70361]|uniref:hypothetical protein n=1 Tax=Streptomyces sp. TRM 70361 TaxID=3116553 RepID=UPI002E7B7815|nr:hypothetical protein [Streptomyces sp. TRM 70361]MEE1938781.1 hypothetical protein [Streptomyces sp. TRM 70361]
MNQTREPLIDILLSYGSQREGIVTLGPAGTSSEAAARHLSGLLSAHNGCETVISLYDDYERAGDALRREEGTLLLVANAYAAISQFYMDPELSLAGAFVFDTPQYGLAARPGAKLTDRVRVASHPAPVPLIEQLIGPGVTVSGVTHTNSTSAAAATASRGEVDLALTTAPAAAAHGLTFVTRTRDIRMLWSVFTSRKRALQTAGADTVAVPGAVPLAG